VHGLRALGLGNGDVVAAVLPNDAPIIELYLAVAQAGMYLVPVNWHLTAPEIAYIVQDSEAKVFVAHERFGDACKKAAAELDFAPERRFAVGNVDGFRPFAELSAGQPDTRRRRAAGA
jgi:long-chain acyl-CoA synthetase